MTTLWQQFYVQTNDAPSVAAALQETLARLGYGIYDPFPGGSGTPPTYKTFAKHFVAPAVEIEGRSWIVVLGLLAPDAALITTLSAGRALIHAWLDEKQGNVDFYHDGKADPARLTAFLRPGMTLENATEQKPTSNQSAALPGELDQFAKAHNVKSDQAAKMFNRVAAQIFGKLDRSSGGEAGTMQNQARAMLNRESEWNGAVGQALNNMLRTLAIPPREPGFEAVRDAYQAARMLRKNPKAQLMPDEREALKRVPNAGDYTAVYGGK